jgi:hypothetical protein
MNDIGKKTGRPDTLGSVLWFSIDPSHEIQVYIKLVSQIKNIVIEIYLKQKF